MHDDYEKMGSPVGKNAERLVDALLGGDDCCPNGANDPALGEMIPFKTKTPAVDLNDPELVARRAELIHCMQAAEEAMRKTLCGLNCVGGVLVDKTKDGRLRYRGDLTMVGADNELYGMSLSGPAVRIDPDHKAGTPIDSRKELAEMFEQMADALLTDIEDHP